MESSWTQADEPFEIPLRPQTLPEFVGQESVCERLEVFISAAKSRKEALGHCLFSGPPGLGKTTLAHIIAKSMGTQLFVTSGPAIEKAGDLAGLLTHLKQGDILFIDEIHRLSKIAEEYLYSAMEDFSLDLMIDSGPNARSVQVKLKPFSLVGATTRSGLLSAPMRSRFLISLRLDYYDHIALSKIIHRTAILFNLQLSSEALFAIAQRSRGTPRIANNLLRWVRDYAQIKNTQLVDHAFAEEALQMLAIDEKGLDEMDKKILIVMIDHHNGGPVGLNTLAAAVGEEAHTLEEVYEPFLILQGLIKRTPRGREATDLAYEHIGRKKLPPGIKQPSRLANGDYYEVI
ncbi:MAG TPA: Holliday junction branch migration DNA helicase RuvB [Chlamydiales bacterium]|nr:Holliday junction branch migration DNA helicase RuvB [Chlamydiales bacterium]